MKIVVVGGGAGGLELATFLGRKLGAKGKAEVLLIDRNHTHLWKPLLHEVAVGSLDAEIDAVSYRAHGHKYGFRFKLGTFHNLDRERKLVHLAPVLDDNGDIILPEREESYDRLIMAIGSGANDFGIPGVASHCMFLDNSRQALRFQKTLVNGFIRLNRTLISNPQACLNIVIVGGGATGVELAAELFNARQLFELYGLDRVTADHLNVTILEAGPRLVPNLSPRVSASVLGELAKAGASVRLGTQVARAEKGIFHTAAGEEIRGDILVWAAGIKAPDFLREIGGLESNRINQLLVTATLQTTRDNAIYAIGDCAGCRLGEDRWVPPRAQSAHQMASLVAANLLRDLAGKPLKDFKYKDHGSLISLSQYATVGVLMGNLGRGSSFNVRGWLARMAYISLYRMHQIALHGPFRALLMVIADRINHIIRPRLKLH